MQDHENKKSFRAPHSPLRGQQIKVTGPLLTDRRITKRIAEGFYGERMRLELLKWKARAQEIKKQRQTKSCPIDITNLI